MCRCFPFLLCVFVWLLYTKKTQEQHTDGTYETITADFRKYACVEDSVADHSAYLLGAKNGRSLRYKGMKYVDLEAVEVAFATMMNRLIYGRNKVLRPFYEALQQSNQTEALLKIHDIQEQLDALVEKKQTIKGLFAKGVIEPAVYTQSLNGVTAEVERLTTEKDALSYIASSEISHIEETRKLLSFADKGGFLDGFDGEIFETYVDRIVVKSQTELEFQMKCGLNLIERI